MSQAKRCKKCGKWYYASLAGQVHEEPYDNDLCADCNKEIKSNPF